MRRLRGSKAASPVTTVTVTASVSASTAPAVTVTVTSSPAPAAVAASEVRACESAHSLPTAAQRSVTGRETKFATCTWPPATGAGADGYLLITATDSSTSLDEASNESEYDLIQGPCTAFRLGYLYANMGVHQEQPVVTVAQGAVDVGASASPVNLAAPGAPDVPDAGRGEAVYLHNASYTVDSASCAS